MFFKAARFAMWILLNISYKIRVVGIENIPQSGAFILCSNHFDSMDPAILTISMKRRMYFMAKNELFVNFFSRQVFTWLGAFPVKRGSQDMQAYKKALSHLNIGNGLLVFIQGTRTMDFSQAKKGAALFALKTDAVLIPAGITGSYKFRTRLDVCFGKPIPINEFKGKIINTSLTDELTAVIVEAVKECCDAK